MAAKSRPARKHRRPAGTAPLTRRVIVEAALAAIDAHGLEAFSMRKLGAALGVEAMALYHHLPSKGALLDGIMERLLEEADLPPSGAMPAIDRFEHFLRSYRRIAIRHPNAFVLLVYRRFNTEPAFDLYERILESLAEAGFDPALSARFFRLAGYFVGGAGMADIASRARTPNATPLRLERFGDDNRYPRIARVAPHLRVTNLDAIFDFGLEVIVQAMRGKVRKARSRPK